MFNLGIDRVIEQRIIHIILMFFLLILVTALLTFVSTELLTLYFFYGGSCLLIVYGIIKVRFLIKDQKKHEDMWSDFARENNMKFFYKKRFEEIMAIDDIHFSPQSLLFQFGTQSTFLYLLDGTAYSAGSFYYMMNTGKNHILFMWNFVHMKLKVKMPHVIFDGKNNNFLRYFSTLPCVLEKNETIKNEKLLKKHFVIYTEEKAEKIEFIDSEFVEFLVSDCANFDIEIFEDNIYVYQKNSSFSMDNLMKLQKVSIQLSEYLNRIS